MKIILNTDGAARGNPGPAALGIVLSDERGKEIEAFGEVLGDATNNVAEYRALLRGLERAIARGASEIEIRTDSELLAQQLKGTYRVRAENLKPLHEQALRALKQFTRVSIRHIPREQNSRADALANQVLDEGRKTNDESQSSSIFRLPSSVPLLIIVTGPPCSGKTTLARRIAKEFSLPLITKDDIKEMLFDGLGWSDREWSKNLGRATYPLIFYFVEAQLAAGCSTIVESNFESPSAERFRALKSKYTAALLQIHCHADDKTLMQRFKARSESGQVFEIDTTNLNAINYEKVFNAIRLQILRLEYRLK